MSKERVQGELSNPDDLNSNKMYSTGYVAELFGVQIDTVRQWIDDGKLPALKVGKNWRIRRADMIKFANSRYKVNDDK